MRLLTPPGIAGIAVVAVPAAQRTAVGAALFTVAGEPLAIAPGAPPRRARIVLDGRIVDEVVVLDRGPLGLELHLHGAPAVLEQVGAAFGLEAAIAAGPAEQLLQHAGSVEQFDFAVEQLAHDFDADLAAARRLPRPGCAAALAAMLRRSRRARAMISAQRVALIGRQNAGKSSLFNRLLFRERAAVGTSPGLTRDPIAEPTVLGGYPYELVDTAGEGDVTTGIDAAAIERGRALRRGALQILVVDGAVGPAAADRRLAQQAALVVATKNDLPPAPWPADVPRHVSCSAADDDAAALRATFGRQLQAMRRLPPAGPVGGSAALSAAERRQLLAAVRDCRAGRTPA